MEERYQRADVLRIVGITGRQLSLWEKAGLAPVSMDYTFTDLVQLTKLRDLKARHVPARVIRRTVHACTANGMARPLVEANVIVDSPSRISVKHEGSTVEPVGGQFVFDFADSRQRVIPIRPDHETVAALFVKGVQLEESPDTAKQAIDVYRQLLELAPNHAAAHINLGTLQYNQQNFTAAEACYRRAIEADPRYALAHFDLGNVLDETGRLADAVRSYERAIELSAEYADAHYNLALAYERLKQPRKALPHWRAYAKLDPVGPWSNHARVQIERIKNQDQLQIVWRRGQGTST